jgi:hypothetical protein
MKREGKRDREGWRKEGRSHTSLAFKFGNKSTIPKPDRGHREHVSTQTSHGIVRDLRS